jgi:nucleotide-binding universal stress UspA family protein
MNILLAVDGSETSLRAAAGLASHVRWFAEPPAIHLLHVHLPVPVGLALQHVSRETLDRYYLEEGEKVLAPASELLRSAGLSTTTHIHVGHPADVIVRLAAELACELVCLGAHGRGAIATAVLGSVALKVLQLSPVPVLLFR